MLIGFICCFAIFGITALLLKSLYRIPEKIVAKEPIADIKYEFNSDIKKIDISKEDFFKSMRIDFINTKKSNVEKLKEYIELLYAGIITQEEFDIKKRQLLGL
jgi:hypothetical protein